ncbi:MAG: sigma-70 family RNA polymerase sigma factor [Armatimonadetes bacterium]|nr:sigma-70 family RNA polymerase sigma factor [Armatimonadota bacterium]
MKSLKTESFERLVRKHKDAVYRQMVRVCSHREDAEDALASALLLAFKSADRLESDDAFRAWLGTIGKRVCSRMRHHPAIEQAFDFAIENKIVRDESDGFDMHILSGCVKEAVDELPEPYRKVYTACEIEGATVPEAAERLGIGLAAAKSRLLRARERVRRRLDQSICAF